MSPSPASSVRSGFPLGLTGAQAATRYVGATSSGAPASGTFAVGDFCIDQTGKVFVCTAAGSPGTWTQIGGSGGGYWDAIVEKSADETVASSTTLQDDNELLFAILANVVYVYELRVVYAGPTAADLKHAFAVSAGTFTGGWRALDTVATNSTAFFQQQLDNTTALASGSDPTQKRVLRIDGWTRGDTNANFVFQWAQNTSDATACTVYAGSTLAYRAMA